MHTSIKLRALVGPNRWASMTTLEVRVVDSAERRQALISAALFDAVQSWLRRRELLLAASPSPVAGNWAAQLGLLITALRRTAGLQEIEMQASDDGATLVFPVEDQSLGQLCADAAFALCQVAQTTGGRKDEAFDEVLERFRQYMIELGFDVPTRMAVRAAQELGIPHRRHSLVHSHYLIGEGRHQIVLDATDTNHTAAMAKDLAANKDLANLLLAAYGFPVPRQETIGSPDQAWPAAQRVGLPAVFKPRIGRQGSGVVLDVKSKAEAVAGFERASKADEEVLVESTLPGDDHRVMVIGTGVIALRRQPPFVTGDGVHSIAQLVQGENARRGRKSDDLRPIELNEDTDRLLAAAHRTLETVLPAGERQQLQLVPNSSWPRTNVSDAIHSETRRMLVGAAQLIGLDIASIDYRTPDIARSWKEVGGGICEIESRSGLWALVRAESGTVGLFVRYLVAGRPLRIPQVLVVGSGDLSALDDWAQSLAANAGKEWGSVALQTSNRFTIDGEEVPCEPVTAARACLRATEHPLVGLAVYVSQLDACLANGFGVLRPDIVLVREDDPQHAIASIAAKAGAHVLAWDQRNEIQALLRACDPVAVPAG